MFIFHEPVLAKSNKMENDTLFADLVLVGSKHPYFPQDDITLPRIADSLIKKSSYLRTVDTFSSGDEFLKRLVEATARYGKIRHLVVMGHSGFQGYFVKGSSGFHRNEYVITINGKRYPFLNGAANVNDLMVLVESRKIVFDASAIIILAGCNTAYGEENIAFDLADKLNIPVVGSNQKVDLYNVGNIGEDMKGLEKRTFIAYLPDGPDMIRYDLSSDYISISRIIEIVKMKLTNITKVVVNK